MEREEQVGASGIDQPKSPREADIAHLEDLARLLDEHFRVPGTNVRIGLDGIIGLIPGVGDTFTAAVALYLLIRARKAGASRALLTRMAGNIALDMFIGAIPVVGDLFDVVFKANRRNVELLRKHLDARRHCQSEFG